MKTAIHWELITESQIRIIGIKEKREANKKGRGQELGTFYSVREVFVKSREGTV